MVGVGHNRWNVMGKAGDMIERMQSQAEVAAIYPRLEAMKSELTTLAGYVKATAVHPMLRPLFP